MTAKSDIRKLSIRFEGKNVPREAFLEDFNDKLIPFVREDLLQWREFVMLLREIVKNIYDHADGRGYTLLKKNGVKRILYFKLGDNGIQSYDLEVLKRASASRKGNSYNFGVGLKTMIPGIAEGLGIELRIVTSQGFYYSGVLKF